MIKQLFTNYEEFVNEVQRALFDRMDEYLPLYSYDERRNQWISKYHVDQQTQTDKSTYGSKIPDVIPLIAHNRRNWSEKEHVFKIKAGGDWYKGLIMAAELLGMEVPKFATREGSESFERRDEGKNVKFLEYCKNQLHTDEGRPVLDYLKGRGYSEEFIEASDFGSITPDAVQKAKELNVQIYERNGGTSWPLLIPNKSNGKVVSFTFRSITDEVSKKYINQKDISKDFIFGLKIGRYRENVFGVNVLIVEGQIDVLRAKYEGFENVCCLQGSDISTGQMKILKNKGITSVTLLYDWDGDKQGNETSTCQTYDTRTAKTFATARKLMNEGIDVFVAEFDQVVGKKIDIDEYLKEHTGDELRQLVNTPLKYVNWACNKIARKYSSVGQSDPNFDKYQNELFDLCTELNPSDRDIVYHYYGESTGITPKGFGEWCEDKIEAERLLTERKKVEQNIQSALEQIKSGTSDPDVIVNDLRTKLNGSRLSDETMFKDMLLFDQFDDLWELCRQEPDDLTLPLRFEGSECYDMCIASGGITNIGGYTGHGKSTILYSAAITHATSKENDGDVMFYTFEESRKKVFIKLLSCYSHEPKRAWIEYNKHGWKDRFKHPENIDRHINGFKDLLRSGRLQIVEKRLSSSELIKSLEYMQRNDRRIKLVCIDYFQLLEAGTKLEIRLDLKETAVLLKDFANETGVPILTAAQLKRINSPEDLTNNAFAEASDIERLASENYMVWNSNKKASNDFNSEKSELCKQLESKGFICGIEGKLYIVHTKSRNYGTGSTCICKFNGENCSVEPLDRKKDETRVRQCGKQQKLDIHIG